MSITTVSKSHEGFYYCKTERGESLHSWISVRASSSLLVTAVVVGSSVCLLIFISLLLLWRYKKNKDQQRNINQTSVPNQSAESQPENSPLQSADSDQICDVVTEVNKRDKDGPLADVTYSEVTFKKNKKKMDKGQWSQVSLVVSPSRSQHFSSDSLSLSCEDQRNSAGWTVRRYTDRNTEDCSKQTGSTCRIVSLSTSDSGVYWCQSESGEKRHPLNITVHVNRLKSQSQYRRRQRNHLHPEYFIASPNRRVTAMLQSGLKLRTHGHEQSINKTNRTML
ncbi:hypothetical protein cypCar_00042068 [Cyprinus carpio]|nr:hypothetical protein cypCar_00042068 [Cyprinus carpio]